MSLQIYIGGEPYTAVERVVTTPTPQTPFLSTRDVIIIAVAVGGGAVLVALVVIYLCVWWRMRGSVSRRKRGTKDRVKKVCRHFLVIFIIREYGSTLYVGMTRVKNGVEQYNYYGRKACCFYSPCDQILQSLLTVLCIMPCPIQYCAAVVINVATYLVTDQNQEH